MKHIGQSAKIAISVALVGAFALATSTTPAAAAPIDEPFSVSAAFNTMGNHPVATTAMAMDCNRSIYGRIISLVATLQGNRTPPTCSTAFPTGTTSAVGTHVYYPTDLTAAQPAPVVLFTGGITSDPGNYRYLAELWASHGFVVAVSFDFVNSSIETPVWGASTLIALNEDPASPLHHKIDLGRTIAAGHSAGGQAAQQRDIFSPILDNIAGHGFHLIGLMPIEPGPLALGTFIRHPMLMLTGSNDVIVPPWSWPRLTQYGLATAAPAYFTVARGATHLSPLEQGSANPFAGITVAWLLHLTHQDQLADSVFDGPHWQLPNDHQFLGTVRNAAAAR